MLEVPESPFKTEKSKRIARLLFIVFIIFVADYVYQFNNQIESATQRSDATSTYFAGLVSTIKVETTRTASAFPGIERLPWGWWLRHGDGFIIGLPSTFVANMHGAYDAAQRYFPIIGHSPEAGAFDDYSAYPMLAVDSVFYNRYERLTVVQVIYDDRPYIAGMDTSEIAINDADRQAEHESTEFVEVLDWQHPRYSDSFAYVVRVYSSEQERGGDNMVAHFYIREDDALWIVRVFIPEVEYHSRLDSIDRAVSLFWYNPDD